MNPMMNPANRCLIAYATREGQTEKIATFIEGRARERGWAVDCVNLRQLPEGGLDLGSYDLLLLGGSLHAGGFEKELVRFVARNRERLPSARTHFFAVSLTSATRDSVRREKGEAEVRRILEKQFPIPFASVELIAGALPYSKYNWLIRFVMKRIAAKEGGDTDTSKDYEYTDWNRVGSYADAVLPDVRSQTRIA